MQVIPNTHKFQLQGADTAVIGNKPEPKPAPSPAIMKKAQTVLEKTGVGIILDHPFFAVLLLRQQKVADPNVATLTTNGKTIKYNPEWVAGLNQKDGHIPLLKEVVRCILHHPTRRGQRDEKTWNEASGYAANHVLAASGFTLPSDYPLPQEYADMTAEQIYAKIYVPPPENGGGGGGEGEGEGGSGQDPNGGNGNNPSGPGDVEDSPAESPSEIAEEEAEQDVATQQAAQVAKAQGKLPGNLQKLIAELMAPKVNWKNELREFVQQFMGKEDQTWAKVNRRFVGQGDYFPGYQSEKLPNIVVAFDTSGSVSDNELNSMFTEMNAIMADFPGTEATVIYCDARITDVQTVGGETGVKFGDIRPKIGRGGTSFEPPFRYVREDLTEDPACLIYMTDMECSFPAPPNYPVLWISTTKDIEAPFGRTVYMDPDLDLK